MVWKSGVVFNNFSSFFFFSLKAKRALFSVPFSIAFEGGEIEVNLCTQFWMSGYVQIQKNIIVLFQRNCHHAFNRTWYGEAKLRFFMNDG